MQGGGVLWWGVVGARRGESITKRRVAIGWFEITLFSNIYYLYFIAIIIFNDDLKIINYFYFLSHSISNAHL